MSAIGQITKRIVPLISVNIKGFSAYSEVAITESDNGIPKPIKLKFIKLNFASTETISLFNRLADHRAVVPSARMSQRQGGIQKSNRGHSMYLNTKVVGRKLCK